MSLKSATAMDALNIADIQAQTLPASYMHREVYKARTRSKSKIFM